MLLDAQQSLHMRAQRKGDTAARLVVVKRAFADAGVGVSRVQSHLAGPLGLPSAPALCQSRLAGVMRMPWWALYVRQEACALPGLRWGGLPGLARSTP